MGGHSDSRSPAMTPAATYFASPNPRRELVSFLLGTLLMLFGSVLHARETDLQATFTILETDPQSPAELHAGDEVYVHFRYAANRPLNIWVRPCKQGQQAAAISSGSPPYPAGEGEGFGWFALQRPGSVDAIHLSAAAAGSGKPVLDMATPASFSWSGERGEPRQPAAWVAPFQQREAERQRQAYQQAMARPTGMVGSLLMSLFGLTLLAAVLLSLSWPLKVLLRWQGGWKLAGVPPLLLLVAWTLKDLRDIAAEPSAHNLWPFECLEAAVLIAAYMLGLSLLRRLGRKP